MQKKYDTEWDKPVRDKPLWGLRVDGPLGRRFLRGLSLTRLWREGCCRAPMN